MTILLNGERIDARGAANVSELTDKFQFTPDSILIEHNGTALFRREWEFCTLHDGDRVEFVHVAAGG
ncbi:MAG TPA: sulfur carrier protein ThiS [Chthoniobacterales bacterium]|nr:sulfur carrier protein ThiS [Chthoniobacterales bacterium]